MPSCIMHLLGRNGNLAANLGVLPFVRAVAGAVADGSASQPVFFEEVNRLNRVG